MLCCVAKGPCRVIALAAVVAGAAGFIVGSSVLDADAAHLGAEGHVHEGAQHQDARDGMRGADPGMEWMARWAEHGEITEHHKQLHKAEGTWLLESEYWMAEGVPAEESTMIAQIRPILGGRFMMEEVSGVMDQGPGQKVPWSGLAISGYDNHKDKYVFAWIDSTGTQIQRGYGEETARNEITYEYECYDPMSGRVVQRKNVALMKSDNEHVFDMFTKQPDGSWFKNMTMTYRRSP